VSVDPVDPVDRFALSPRRITDADWFGLEANRSGTITVPVTDPYAVQPAPQAPAGTVKNNREYRRPTHRTENRVERQTFHD